MYNIDNLLPTIKNNSYLKQFTNRPRSSYGILINKSNYISPHYVNYGIDESTF